MTRPEFTRTAFLRGGAAVASGTILSSILAAVLTALLGVELGEDGYGTYAFVIATAGLLASVGRFGVGPIVVREIARSVSEHDRLGRREPIVAALAVTITATAITVAIVVSPLGTGLLEAMADLEPTMVGALAALFAGQALYGVSGEALRGLHRQGWGTLLTLPTQRIVSLVLIGGTVWVLARNVTLATALWLTAAAGLVAAVLAAIVLWYQARALPTSRVRIPAAISMARDGTPVMVTNILGVLATRMPIWVLAVLGDVAEAGVYALAAAFVALIRLGHRTMLSTAAPFIASSYHKGEMAGLERRLKLVAAATSLLALMAGVLMVVGGIVLVPRVFGDDFGDSVVVSIVLIIGTLFLTYSGAAGMVLNVTGYERYMARATIISLVLSAAAMFPAAVIWGATGAAIVQAAMIALRVGLQLRYARRYTGIDTRADYAALGRAVAAGLRRRRRR